ncbi:MAG: hypothetical protein HZB25_04080 [Candidatus Eisenbacteria bacterium]|nr:hypothetical protein [Candidatus Eisenbacteria bacterium]
MQNRGRWFYYLVSCLALGVGLWGAFRQQWPLGELPAPLLETAFTYPARAEGVTVGSPAQLHFHIQAWPAGRTIRIESAGVEHRVTLVHELTRFHFVLALLVGLFFFAVNLFVFAHRMGARPPAEGGAPGDVPVRDFYWATLLYGMAILIGGVHPPTGRPWPDSLLPLLWTAGLGLLPVFFVHLTLAFPRRQRLLDRLPWLVPGLTVLALAIVAWQFVALLTYLRAPGPAAWAAAGPPQTLSRLFLVACVAAGCVFLFTGMRRLELTRERQQVKWLVWGFMAGITPYVFLRTLPRLFGAESPAPPELDRIFELCIPIAFALAVVRYRFLDIDIILRRSLLYTVLAVVMGAVYAALAALAGAAVRPLVPAARPYVPTVAALSAVLLFLPTRRVIGLWVDRTFFKIRYDHQVALAQLRAALPAASGQEELARMLRAFFKRHLQPRVTVVLVHAAEGTHAEAGSSARLPEGAESLAEEAAGGLGRPRAAAGSTSLPELERPDFPARLREAGVCLVAPLTTDGRPQGWVLLGEKRAERRYIEQDIDLVEGAAAEAATALDRVRLVQRVAEEAAAHRRLDELNQLKTDFLSRVAHDLRTPITSIRWSAQNLLDGVAGPTEPRQREYLEAIRISAGQLGRLVGNLLEISRLELGAAKVELGPVDVGELLREVAAGLKPLAAGRGVTIEVGAEAARSAGAAGPPSRGAAVPGADTLAVGALPPALANREKLYEVVANLLENAIRYSPPGEKVEAALAPVTGGAQRFTVRDHGPGLPADERDRLFERFRQGRPSPYVPQGGFGLGLYVVRSFMELMQGTVSADNHPEGGAVFTCTLRDADAPRGENS